MKYVILVDECIDRISTPDWPKDGQIVCSNPAQKLPLVFPDGLTHSVVVEQLQKIYPGLKAISAGFCGLTEDGWYCEGFSTSLGLRSREQTDANILASNIFHSVAGA